MRGYVVGNVGDADPGFVGERLQHHGVELQALDRERPGSWPDLEDSDLLLVLGSAWSVYWEHHREVVEAEASLVRAAQRRSIPTLAICYGAQLVAHALGGSVVRAAKAEIGWYEVEPAPGSAVAPGPWFQWHLDTFAAPPGAELLATSDVGPQAFRLGRTMAVQFHPEVDEEIVGRWCGSDPDDLMAVNTTAALLLDRTRREVVGSRPRAHELVDHFLTWAA
jgi:GMP synthase-like glutamine amidotransferase